jgi:hypothetical protein
MVDIGSNDESKEKVHSFAFFLSVQLIFCCFECTTVWGYYLSSTLLNSLKALQLFQLFEIWKSKVASLHQTFNYKKAIWAHKWPNTQSKQTINSITLLTFVEQFQTLTLLSCSKTACILLQVREVDVQHTERTLQPSNQNRHPISNILRLCLGRWIR